MNNLKIKWWIRFDIEPRVNKQIRKIKICSKILTTNISSLNLDAIEQQIKSANHLKDEKSEKIKRVLDHIRSIFEKFPPDEYPELYKTLKESEAFTGKTFLIKEGYYNE